MEAAEDSGYKPAPEFQDDTRDPLIDLNLTDSTELWLIQWPKDQFPDLDGHQVSLDLDGDGELGNIEVSQGKSYKVMSDAYQEPDATVFLSSGSESKIVGKVTRRVSLVHFPEPSEIPKQDAKVRMLQERSVATSLTNSFTTPSKSIRPKPSQSTSRHRTSTHSSGHISNLSEKEALKSLKKKNEPSRSMNLSGQDSGRTHSSGVTATETGEHSQVKKSKKRKNEPFRSMDQSGQDLGRTHSGVTSTGTREHSQETKSKRSKKEYK